MACDTVLEVDEDPKDNDNDDGEEEVEGTFTWPCCAAPFVSPCDGEFVCVHCKRVLQPPPTWTPRVREHWASERARLQAARGGVTDRPGALLQLAIGGTPLEPQAAKTAANAAPPPQARPVPHKLMPFVHPKNLALPPGARLLAAACGSDHTLLLVGNVSEAAAGRGVPDWRGRVLSFGDNGEGELGHNDGLVRASPHAIAALEQHEVVAVACGGNFSLALTSGGVVCGFGDNACGQLGDSGGESVQRLPVWMTWVARETNKIVAIAAGRAHSVLLNNAGTVFTVGSGDFGQVLNYSSLFR